MYLFLKIYSLTPFPKLSDPMRFLDESIVLAKAFDELKQKANIPTPNWDALQSYIYHKKNAMSKNIKFVDVFRTIYIIKFKNRKIKFPLRESIITLHLILYLFFWWW